MGLQRISQDTPQLAAGSFILTSAHAPHPFTRSPRCEDAIFPDSPSAVPRVSLKSGLRIDLRLIATV